MTKGNNSPLAALANLGTRHHFEHVIEGIYGTFETPAGRVSYLQTKAKVGGDGSTHGKLIKALVPAREALNIQEMDFNQLLQRDLDDHRIATKLIEYVLNPPANSLPGFFPPVLALLLPFNQNQTPVDYFPKPTESFEKDNQFANIRFRCITHENSYRVQYAVNQDNDGPLEIPLAVLRWNPELSKMVIMDGQHRAMSLLAIQRTFTKSWSNAAKGARYQPFYEHHVKNWAKKAADEGKTVDLSKIELPVTICWFPEAPSDAVRPRPHSAARKLFVDVNNNAKPPSEARLILMSDTQLDNIFARELLNHLRDTTWRNSFPLYGVEYDNPDKNSTSPKRWSVITSLDIIKDAVVRTVFGPPKIIKDPTASLQGGPPLRDMDIRMREQLNVSNLFPRQFQDGERMLICENLGNYVFPLNDSDKIKKLLDRFYDNWGKGILTLLSEVEPYKMHLQALQDLYTNWNPSNNNSILAKDALFEGVGMLWTIEEGHKLWQLERKNARDARQTPPDQPDISKAWMILEDQKPIFQKRRAMLYLGSDNESDVTDCERLFTGLVTYAAQVGLMLAWASLHANAAPSTNPSQLADALAKAINQTLCTGPTASRDRKRILLKQSDIKSFWPLNSLPKLEPAYASQYRYFWLELALAAPGRQHLVNIIDVAKAEDLLGKSYHAYLRVLLEERIRQRSKDPDIRQLNDPGIQKREAEDKAVKEIIDEQANARKYWFGTSIDDARKEVKMALANSTPAFQVAAGAIDSGDEASDSLTSEGEGEDDEN
jgi:hypothetical protein